jgi:hypothetical protein
MQCDDRWRLVMVGVAMLWVTLCTAPRSWGQFVLTGQTRSMFAEGDDPMSQSDTNMATGTYNKTAFDTGGFPLHGATYTGTGSASQNSDIETTGFSGTGSASASVSQVGVGNPPALFCRADASSGYTADFSVTAPTSVLLTGELDGTGTVGNALITLTGPGVSFSQNKTGTFTDPFTDSVTLAAGSYELKALLGDHYTNVGSLTSSFSDSATTNFNFSLTAVPEPTSVGMIGLAAASLLARRRSRIPRSR